MLSKPPVSYRSLIGQVARWPLRVIPRSAKMPILKGPMRGLKWIVGSHTHGCWLGWYEPENQHHWMTHCRPGMVVYDIGANVGFYTLMASVLTGPTGRVFAFEPLPRNLNFLHEHVRANRLRNVTVFEDAVADQAGEAMLEEAASAAMSKLSDRGCIKVNLVALDELLAAGKIPVPNLMKIDVEGAEVAVFKGAQRLMREHRPVLFLSTHGEDVHARCLDVLRGWGYRLSSMNAATLETTREVLALPA